MLYLVPIVLSNDSASMVVATMIRLGIQAFYVAPLAVALELTTPVIQRARTVGHLTQREMCAELLKTQTRPNVTDAILKAHGLTINRLSGHMPSAQETMQEYGQRVRSWFTDYFLPRLHQSPVPTVIVAPYDVCMLIAEYLTKFQMNRAILPSIPEKLRRPGSILEYVNSGTTLQASRFIM